MSSHYDSILESVRQNNSSRDLEHRRNLLNRMTIRTRAIVRISPADKPSIVKIIEAIKSDRPHITRLTGGRISRSELVKLEYQNAWRYKESKRTFDFYVKIYESIPVKGLIGVCLIHHGAGDAPVISAGIQAI